MNVSFSGEYPRILKEIRKALLLSSIALRGLVREDKLLVKLQKGMPENRKDPKLLMRWLTQCL